MEDTFGRLPSDVLKYMCLLSVTPQISLLINNAHFIKIELPLIGFSYLFELNNLQNLETEMIIHLIDEFNNGTSQNIDFGDHQIILVGNNIIFYTEHSNMIIDIKYLKLLQDVLREYKEHITRTYNIICTLF